MASTAAGRALTERFRVRSLRAAVSGQGALRRATAGVGVSDASLDPWLGRVVPLVMSQRLSQAGRAATYVRDFRAAEGKPGGIVVPDLGDRDTVSAGLSGEHRRLATRAARVGLDPVVAGVGLRRQLVAAAATMILEGARGTVQASATAMRRKWRRVTDGDPCAFCSMLASRGPIYQSQKTALGEHPGHYHNYCGCTAEEAVVEGWDKTPDEQARYDHYKTCYDSVSDRDVKDWLSENGTPGGTTAKDAYYRAKTRVALQRMRQTGGYRDATIRRIVNPNP